MPILKVEVVGKREEFPRNLAQQIADSAATELDSRPQGTWVTTTFIQENDYAENGGRDESLNPVLISLVLSDPPANGELQSLIAALTTAIASVVGVPSENVHIIVEPAARGRVSFGGRLVT